MPELSEREKLVLGVVREHWPISSIEVASHLNEDLSSRKHTKRHSTNYAYYLKKLVQKRLVLSKRIGNALVVWPIEVEAYRTIHDILRDSPSGSLHCQGQRIEPEFGPVPMGVR